MCIPCSLHSKPLSDTTQSPVDIEKVWHISIPRTCKYARSIFVLITCICVVCTIVSDETVAIIILVFIYKLT